MLYEQYPQQFEALTKSYIEYLKKKKTGDLSFVVSNNVPPDSGYYFSLGDWTEFGGDQAVPPLKKTLAQKLQEKSVYVWTDICLERERNERESKS